MPKSLYRIALPFTKLSAWGIRAHWDFYVAFVFVFSISHTVVYCKKGKFVETHRDNVYHGPNKDAKS